MNDKMPRAEPGATADLPRSLAPCEPCAYARTTRVAATGSPAYSETLPRRAEAASAARLLVTHALAVWHLDALTDDATLIVTELVANAVNHARGESIRVAIAQLADHGALVSVFDASRVDPKLHRVGPDEERGRVLVRVAAVSERWGTDPLPWGKRVWARMRVPS
ncbi:ATP-binding protein [Streptomyces sp. NPDC004749]